MRLPDNECNRLIAAIMELGDNPTVKTLLNTVGFVVILCVLLYLPTVGYGVPGLKGTALGLIAGQRGGGWFAQFTEKRPDDFPRIWVPSADNLACIGPLSGAQTISI